MSEDWSKAEVTLIVDDYFSMFQQELERLKYNKTAHRKELLPKLTNRTNRAVESKHQNISAVLTKLGQPYIKGYKPLHHYQFILEEQVTKYLQKNISQLEPLFERFAEEIISPTLPND